ncbi:unnamed protein product, partial [Gongylonema pulchrum]|uniref:SH3 domain-containing protein n=1 Tax=Gongylonema pulchrum TaxID=637853 RepID=A0A183ED34_9BILA
MIKKWTENECKHEPSLGLIETLYKNLVADGQSFEPDNPPKSRSVSTDPNAVQSAEEEEALMLAIAKSLQETSVRNNNPPASSLYPSTASTGPTNVASVLARPVPNGFRIITNFRPEREVRALYDFEAAEDNELTFLAGDIIVVTDDSDVNWWRGRSHRGEGLFPANFVTSNLQPEEIESPILEKEEPTEKVSVARIDKSILMECLNLLESCDPTGERPDPPELADLEQRSLAQAPLIDARLAEIDRQHNALAEVDLAIRDVLTMYDRAVQQVQYKVRKVLPSDNNLRDVPTGPVQPEQQPAM